jgi:hypothetical protein
MKNHPGGLQCVAAFQNSSFIILPSFFILHFRFTPQWPLVPVAVLEKSAVYYSAALIVTIFV